MNVFWNVGLGSDLAIHMMLYIIVPKLYILQSPQMLTSFLQALAIPGRSDLILLSKSSESDIDIWGGAFFFFPDLCRGPME